MINTNLLSSDINNLKIAQINIRSLVSMAKREEFRLFLKKYKPDIVLISETHLKPKHKINFDGYKFYRSDRLDSSCGGTAICILENILSAYIKTPESIQSIESCSIRIDLEHSAIILSAIYRKPTKKINCVDLTTLINIDKNAIFILAGDFNAHSPLWGSNKMCPNGREINEWFDDNKHSLKMKTIFPRDPSCSVSETGSYIDFAIMSDSINITNSDSDGRLPSEQIFSDHSVIFMNVKCDKIKKIEPMKIKNFKKTNWNGLNNYIDMKLSELNIPLFNNMNANAINDVCEKIESIFMNSIEKFVPEIKIRVDQVELSTKSLSSLKEKKNS